jgi:hypothetical protein
MLSREFQTGTSSTLLPDIISRLRNIATQSPALEPAVAALNQLLSNAQSFARSNNATTTQPSTANNNNASSIFSQTFSAVNNAVSQQGAASISSVMQSSAIGLENDEDQTASMQPGITERILSYLLLCITRDPIRSDSPTSSFRTHDARYATSPCWKLVSDGETPSNTEETFARGIKGGCISHQVKLCYGANCSIP